MILGLRATVVAARENGERENDLGCFWTTLRPQLLCGIDVGIPR